MLFYEYYNNVLKEKINIFNKVPDNIKNDLLEEIDELNELLDNFT